MRALVVTNMYPSAAFPARGRFVLDQVQRAAAARLASSSSCTRSSPATQRVSARRPIELRRRFRGTRFDVVHAHFGLTAWPALAARARAHAVTLHGTDLAHPRSRAITLAALPLAEADGDGVGAACRARAALGDPRPSGGGAAVRRRSPAVHRRSTAAEARRELGAGPRRRATCCSRPIPRAPRSDTTSRSRSPAPRTWRC